MTGPVVTVYEPRPVGLAVEVDHDSAMVRVAFREPLPGNVMALDEVQCRELIAALRDAGRALRDLGPGAGDAE